MGGQQSRGGDAGQEEQDRKDKKAKKYEAPPPTRVGKKKKKKSGPTQSARVPTVVPATKCKLRLLKLERVKDYLLMEEEFVLRQEQVKPQEETAQKERAKVEDLRGSPMNVASLEEMIDDNHAIVASSVGPEYYVNIMSFVDKDQLEPGCSLLTHYKVNSIVGLLADEADPMVSVMKVDKAPLESYADIGGLETQIMEMKEAVELPLTHPEVRARNGPRAHMRVPPADAYACDPCRRRMSTVPCHPARPSARVAAPHRRLTPSLPHACAPCHAVWWLLASSALRGHWYQAAEGCHLVWRARYRQDAPRQGCGQPDERDLPARHRLRTHPKVPRRRPAPRARALPRRR